MKQYIKDRMTFALALLGVVLTLYPFVKDHEQLGFFILNISFNVYHFYIVFGILLGCSVYFYALQFTDIKIFNHTERLAGYCFLIALLTPAIYFVLLLFNAITLLLSKIPGEEWLSILAGALGLVVSVTSGIMGFYLGQRKFKAKEREENLSIESAKGYSELEVAKELIKSGFYGSAIPHIYNAIMLNIRKILIANNFIEKEVPDFQTVQLTKSKKIFSNEIVNKIHQLRLKRNQVAHGAESPESITEAEAQEYMDLAREIFQKSNTETFIGGSPCQMSGQKCPACKEGIMDVSPGEDGVECNKCSLYIPVAPARW